MLVYLIRRVTDDMIIHVSLDSEIASSLSEDEDLYLEIRTPYEEKGR